MGIQKPKSEFKPHKLSIDVIGFRITKADVENAIRTGLTHKQERGPLHPRASSGIAMFDGVVFGLRSALIPKEWRKSDICGQSGIQSPNGEIRIVVAQGNEHTGLEGPGLNRKYPLGRVASRQVECNGQLLLDFGESYSTITTKQETWFLLHNTREGKVHFELSFAVPRDRAGSCDWAKRIFFPPIEVGAQPEKSLPEANFNVKVDRI